MPRLNQIIALVKGKKAEVQSAATKFYHQLQKKDLFAGLTKTYDPKDEEGEKYPGDSKRLQRRAEEILQKAGVKFTELMDLVEIQDRSNCVAKANVVVDGNVLLQDVPPTYLMFLEHKLTDITTLLEAVPVVDPVKDWSYSTDSRCYRSDPIRRTKTKKVSDHKVAVEATEHHPAQVIEYTTDIVEGYWETVEFSGAVTEERKHEILRRVKSVREAVVTAREEANSMKVSAANVGAGKSIFDFILKEE